MVESSEKRSGSFPAHWRFPSRLRRAMGPALLLATSAIVGCADESPRLPVVPVTGKVTFKGEAPDGAYLVFHPVKPLPKQEGGIDTPNPSGQVKADGSFQLTTYDGNDGAPAGDYSVTLQWYKLVKSGPDVKAGPNVIPAKYASPGASPWKVTVADKPTELPPQDIRK